ncbi:MAG TPA: hypothetical protein VND93_19555 [Myxococcales bacterium]|nr:hypothetical protein [Myxococcales bacterium]
MIDLAHHERALRAQVPREIRAFRARLEPTLAAALDARLAALGVQGEADALHSFTRVAQPVVHLPLWVAEAAAARGRPPAPAAIEAAVAAAVLGYLCAQVQDAVIDGEEAAPGRAMLLAHALFAAHGAALDRAAGPSPELSRLREEKWMAYAGALAVEARSSRGEAPMDEAAFDGILRRSHPLVLPGAALLAAAGLWELVAPLEELVAWSTRAAQLFDDLVDAVDDLRAGRFTWVVRRLGGERGERALVRRLYLEGGFDEIAGEALSALASAEAAAGALGMRAGGAALAGDGRRIQEARAGVAKALARQIFGAIEGLEGGLAPAQEEEHT